MQRITRGRFGYAFLASATLALATPTTLSAQSAVTDTLVRDIHRGAPTQTNGSNATVVGRRGNLLWLSATSDEIGREFWVTDGTASGTRLATDLNPGRASGDFSRRGPMIALSNGRLVFSAFSRQTGAEPFVVPATSTTPVLLIDIVPGAGSSIPSRVVEWHGEAWFAATTSARGRELWRSDGTAAGTLPGGDVVPGPASIDIDENHLYVAGNKLYFLADDGGQKLYVKASPNSPAQLLLDLNTTTPFGVNDWYAVEVAGQLMFPHDAAIPRRNPEPWITDGTPAGTRQLSDLTPGPTGTPDLRILAGDGSRVWFSATTPSVGNELWITDGTTAGTAMVADAAPGPASSLGSFTTAALLPNGDLVFTADDGAGAGRETWRSDGTAAGTRLLADIAPGSDSSEPSRYLPQGGDVWCSARTATEGRELWRIDTTTGAAQRMTDTMPGAADGEALPLADLGNRRILFAGRTERHGREPRTIGTIPGSDLLLADINPDRNADADPQGFLRSRGLLFFQATDEAHGIELWQTDGTELGTRLVADLAPGTEDSDAWPVGSLDDGVVFSVRRSGGLQDELWISDGASGSTRRLAQLPGGGNNRPVVTSMRIGHRLLFATFDADPISSRVDLWTTDGTAAGTGPVPGWNGLFDLSLHVSANDTAIGVASRSPLDSELFVSDGTAAGTEIFDVSPGTTGSFPSAFARVGEGAVFAARHPSEGVELFYFDSQTRGLGRISNFAPGTADVRVRHMTSLDDIAVFTVEVTGISPAEFWRTDGTAAGTVPFAGGLVPGLAAGTSHAVRVGRRVWFWSTLPLLFADTLWSTDGSRNGTYQIADALHPGYPFDAPTLFPLGGGGRAAFASEHPTLGEELWVSDGTGPGTRLLADSASGPGASRPDRVHRVGTRLVFTADDGRTGVELHAVQMRDAGAWAASPYGSGCGADIDTIGRAVPRAPFRVDIETAPAVPVSLLNAAAPDRLELVSGCSLQLLQPTTAAIRTSSLAGEARFQLPIPNVPTLVGAAIYLQGFALVPGGPLFGQLESTPGLEVVIGR